MDELQARIHGDLERQFRRGYRIGICIIACLYMALIPYYLKEYPPPVGGRVVWAVGVTVVLLFAVFAALSWSRIPHTCIQPLGAAAMGVILIPILVQLSAHGSWRLHVDMGLVLVTNGLVLYSLWYFLWAELVTVALWIRVCLPVMDGGDLFNLGLAVACALVVSTAAHVIVVGLLRNQENLRLQDLQRGREQTRLLEELQSAFEHVRTLRGLVPICSQCKKVRDDSGFWQRVETYVEEHSHAEFTHGLCPECTERLKHEFDEAVPPEDAEPR